MGRFSCAFGLESDGSGWTDLHCSRPRDRYYPMSSGERLVRSGASSIVWPFIAIIVVASSCTLDATPSSTSKPTSSGSVDGSPTFPSGSIEYEGIHLVPVGAELRQACQTGADALGFAVPCPQLIPYGSEVRPCEPILPGDEVCPPPDQEFHLQNRIPSGTEVPRCPGRTPGTRCFGGLSRQ